MTTLSVISSSSDRGVKAGMIEDRRHVGDEVRLGELARRQVHAHHQRGRRRDLALPLAGLAAGRLEDPAADRQDQPGLLRQRDERERRHEPSHGMLPAQEGLHPHDAAGGEVHQWLVVEAQLGAFDRAPEVVLQRGTLDGLGPHLGVEQDRAPERVRLGPVEGDLRLLEQVAGVGDDRPVHRQAQAGPDADLPAVEVERFRDGRLDARRHQLGLADAAHRAEQDPELVAAEARDRVGGAGRRQQALADLRQQQVARGVAQALVHDLEPVEVEEDEPDPRPRRRARPPDAVPPRAPPPAG